MDRNGESRLSVGLYTSQAGKPDIRGRWAMKGNEMKGKNVACALGETHMT